MSVKRYEVEIPIQYKIREDTNIETFIFYDCYASNEEQAKDITRLFVNDMGEKISENVAWKLSDKIRERRPMINGDLKATEVAVHTGYENAIEDLPLLVKDDC